MRDLVLDNILGKELIGIEEDGSVKELRLKFKEGVLRCYHLHYCCGAFVYLGKESSNLGVVAKASLESTHFLDKENYRELRKLSKDISCYLRPQELNNGDYTLTILKLIFLEGTNNTFKFFKKANSHYYKAVQLKWLTSNCKIKSR